ncbi:MAG TPA: glycosyltransferase family 4 protein [Sedimentisphaerales bacterium]|nr:glycosyltransferase family 4 protein [Sedimentisphaerales bacterium]
MTEPDKSKPVKVCCVAPKAYPIFNPQVGDYFGGAEVDLYYLAIELAKDKDFQVSFIVADYGQPAVEIWEGVTVIRTVDFTKSPVGGAWRVWKGLARADADIYLFKTASPGGPLIALFCKVHKRLYGYRAASSQECDGTYIRKHRLLGPAFAWSLRQAKILFTQNAVDAENLSAGMGLHAHTIPNGHPLPPLNQQKRDTILWVGRDAEVKRPRRFLELARKMPDRQFTMICQSLNHDRNYADLMAEAAEVKNLQFISHVPFDRIERYFERALVFVNTSEWEGFPNTFIQACMCATPILSLNVNPDGFLDKYGCGFCCKGDSRQLIDLLRFLLQENRYIDFGRKAREYAEQNHDIAAIAEKYKHLLCEIQ